MPENHSFENTNRLVEKGLYHYIRHPMYASLLMLCWGAFLKSVTLQSAALACFISMFLFFAAKREEHENISFFGPAYEQYRGRTKMFIPWLL